MVVAERERLLVKMGYLNYRSRHTCIVDDWDATLKIRT